MITVQYLPETKEYRLQSEIWLPRPLDEVFEFFSDAHNLQELTPALLQFEVLTPGPVEMFAGQLIDYRLKVHGIPIKWQSEITIWEPPYRFADVQVKGPYKKWDHTHRFEEKNGGTLVIDKVLYQPPGGRLVNWLAVEQDVRKIFTFRAEFLEERFPPAENTELSLFEDSAL